jgi:NADPH2 dehydrogenase
MKTFFLPVNTGYFTHSIPTEECIKFYEDRCSEKLYCIIVGNVITKKGYGTNNYCGRIANHNNWLALADKIKAKKIVLGIQLSTTWENYTGQRDFINHEYAKYENEIASIINKYIIDDIIDDFKKSIVIANDLGFEFIQIHAAHGYLLSYLIDPDVNKEADNCTDRLLKLGDYIKEKNLISSIRVSQYCGFDEIREGNRIDYIKKLFNKNYDYIDLSEGYYNFDKNYIYPVDLNLINKRIKRSLAIAKLMPKQQFIISGRVNITSDFPCNNINIGICRSLIANNNFMSDHNEKCDNCGSCHYFSNNQNKLKCNKWKK